MPESNATVQDRRRLPGWFTPAIFVAGLVAAILTEPAVNANHDRFYTDLGLPPWPDELLWRAFIDEVKNHSICYGVLGMATVGLIAMVVGAIRSPLRAVITLVASGIVGLCLGAAVGIGGWYLDERILRIMDIDSILKAFIIFIPLWLIIMFATNVCSLLAIGRSALMGKAFINSLFYSIIAVVVYVAIITFAYPTDWPGLIVPEFSHARWVLYIAGCLGASLSVFSTIRKDRNNQSEN